MVPDNNFVQDDVTTLEDYLAAIRNRKWTVVATTLLIFAVAFLATSGRVASYTAEGEIQVGLSPVNSTRGTPAEANLELERSVLRSDEISAEVASLLRREGYEVTAAQLQRRIKISFIPDSQRLDVSYTSTDREFAADVVNTFAEVYVEDRRTEAEAYYDERIAVLDTQIAEAVAIQQSLEEQIAALVASTNGVNLTDIEEGQISGQVSVLRTEVNAWAQAIRVANTDLNELRLERNALQPAGRVLLSAAVPGSPDGIPRAIILAGAAIAGLLFGTAAAFLIERLDTTARDEADVSLAVGARVMASVPAFPLGSRSGTSSAIMLSHDRKPRLGICREAFRRLRSSVQFASASTGAEVFLFTSAFPGEGKSVASANLALALAQSGKHVALVSADMRRPTLERILGVPNDEGLSDFLGGKTEMELKTVEGVDNLWFVPAGPPPANPGELLGSLQFETLIKELRTMASYVLIDSPPVLSTADAATAATHTDGVLLVVDSRRTETPDLLKVRDELERAGASIVGAVLNRTRARRGFFSRRDTYSYYETGQS